MMSFRHRGALTINHPTPSGLHQAFTFSIYDLLIPSNSKSKLEIKRAPSPTMNRMFRIIFENSYLKVYC